MPRTPLTAALLVSTLVVALSAGVLPPAGDCSHPLAADGAYLDISVPGTSATYPQAINDRGEIVGYSVTDEPEAATGFLLRRGEFTSIMVPGSFNTSPTDINNAGVVVGSYCVFAPLFGCGAFSWHHGKFTTWPTSGDFWESGYRLKAINNAGTIVGKTATHGLLLRQGGTELIDVPNASATSIEDINERSDLLITASFDDPLRAEHFLQTEKGLQTIRGCAPWDEALIRLTNQRELVGWARLGGTDPSVPSVGLIASSRGVTLYQYPGSGSYGWAGLFDVNSSGDVVGVARTGMFREPSDNKGFVFVPRRPERPATSTSTTGWRSSSAPSFR